MMRNLTKPLLLLVAIVVFFSIFARMLSGSETLSDYEKKHPPTPKDGETEIASDAADSSLSENTITEESNDEYTTETVPEFNLEGIEQTMEEYKIYLAEDVYTYKKGFLCSSLSDSIKERINGISYGEDCTVPYEDLRYLQILYFNFEHQEALGEIICNKAIASDLLDIFYELYLNEYELERVELVDEYDGDDLKSMEANNTSCFNYRVVEGTTTLSKHALGLAIDINPFYNPYIVFNKNGSGEDYISPAGSEIYVDRSKSFPYKIDENDICYKLFIAHGFTWGGNWNSTKDYQHFQKKIAE
ncbi:MAG: M15 family metallopeptidase [Lachnospiraceae bacterium]|nr:M15 family metallopeptidase [Lachnospiraceae bacterium]